MAGEGRTDRPNYKASSHRLRSSMRNDRQGRRIEIEGKEDCERGGDRPGRSWLRRQGAPSRHYPLTGNYPSSGRLAEGSRARARARTLYTLFLFFPFIFFPLFLLHLLFLLLYSAAGKIAVRNRRYHCSAGRGREEDPTRGSSAGTKELR